jgi:hypothetical protein
MASGYCIVSYTIWRKYSITVACSENHGATLRIDNATQIKSYKLWENKCQTENMEFIEHRFFDASFFYFGFFYFGFFYSLVRVSQDSGTNYNKKHQIIF